MNDESVTKDIFMALDTDYDGYISKQHVINQMAEYLSESEIQCTEYAMKKLSIVNYYPDKMDYEEFCLFYRDLMETKSPVEDSEHDQDKTELDQSDSEIYESNDNENDLNMSRSSLQGSVIDLSNLKTTGNYFSTKDRRSLSIYGTISARRSSTIGSTRKRPSLDWNKNSNFGGVSDLITDESVESEFTSMDNGGANYPQNYLNQLKHRGSVCCDHLNNELDELSCLTDSGVSVVSVSMATEEVDRLSKSYKSVVSELDDVKKRLEESNSRYQKQRDTTRFHNERIMMLEEQLRQLEQFQADNLESKSKEMKMLTETIDQKRQKDCEENSYNERMFKENILNRLSVIESEYNFSRKEYNKIKNEYDILLKEKEQLRKDLKVSEKRNKELENTLSIYKENVKLQLEELQKERDNAENLNRELTERLHSSNQQITPSPPSVKCRNNRPLSWNGNLRQNSNGNVNNNPNIQQSSKTSLADLSMGSFSPTSNHSLSWQHSCTTISQLEQIVHRLTMDNRNLVEKVTHLETLDYFKRPSTSSSYHCYGSNQRSLADEMEQLNYTELKNELAKEREVATRLHIYIISLTNRLMQEGYIDAFRQRGCSV